MQESNQSAAAATAEQEWLSNQKTLFGHPVGLYFLFFTEAWERFSYYGMQALLMVYMTDYLFKAIQHGKYVFGFGVVKAALEAVFGHLAIQPLASQIFGTYTAFVYLTPLFGGMIADRVLGKRNTVVIGAILMAIGHFLMAVGSMFLMALLFLIIGSGCFKPNISTQVGSLYPHGDARRDRAFLIFYMGINLGALFSPLVCGTLGQKVGWDWGFGAAGVGMLVGLTIYLIGQRYLPKEARVRRELSNANSGAKAIREPLTAKEKKAIIGLIVLCLLNVVFWAVYAQQGNTLMYFADRSTDWHIFGWEMPSTWFESLNPFFIIILTPLLSRFWMHQGKRNKEPSTVNKMAMGCFFLGGSFIVLLLVTRHLLPAERISFLWLVLTTLIYTIGELYLSPIGLSLVTKVSPARLVGMMMGMWFLSSFFGNELSGIIGMFYSSMSQSHFFGLLMMLGIASGIAIWAVNRPLTRALGEEV